MTSDYEKVLDAILTANSVCFFATGDAVASCYFASSKFARLGVRTMVCSDVVYQYETAMRLTEKDVAFAITSSGRSSNVVNAMKLSKNQNAFTCCITQSIKSPLLKYCDVQMFISNVDTTIGRDSVTKRIAEITIIEALYLGIINKGTGDYMQMLQNTMLSSEMNKV